MAQYNYIGDGNPDGSIIGNTGEKLGFYGTTPVAVQNVSTAVSTTASVSTSGHYGFASSTETMQIVNCVSTMAYALTQLGLIAAI